ncbi:MAG: hypothetical protein CEE42_04810 [Promethearchaeota archaeon Loki_b31]|nr:MAG: hypothetical protein CEE42_04810 [Candidatus Lokiarchaeota archaeon Loki_b31]
MTNFYPIIGWPAGRGEYDNLFNNLSYFCNKINHYTFLFNFSSFIFGFTIPKSKPYFNNYKIKYKGKNLRDILAEYTPVDIKLAQNLKILLDVGGNRIFNKIINDNLPVNEINSYRCYFEAYFEFIKNGRPDIYVNFDIGPSYSSRNEISIKGREEWNKLSLETKENLNNELLDISIQNKHENCELMVPINAINPADFKSKLQELYNNHSNKIDYIGIAGIANQGVLKLKEILRLFSNFKEKHNWEVRGHGLGLGGWKKIFFLVFYGIESCDVATPWRRACTDRISQVYIPLLDNELNITNYSDPFKYEGLYNDRFKDFTCNCPFCNDISIAEVRSRCMEADKKLTNQNQHGTDFREMRIRVFFHNLYQHIALLRKLYTLKEESPDNFIRLFLDQLKNSESKKKIKTIVKSLI